MAGQPREGARPLLGEDTDRKSCLPSSNASSLLFFNWVVFRSPHKTRGLSRKASPCHQTIAALWCQGNPQYHRVSPVPAAPQFSPSPPFCCSSGSVQPYAYLGLLNITGTARRPRPYPGTHAWRGHGVAKSPRNRKKRGWGKGQAAGGGRRGRELPGESCWVEKQTKSTEGDGEGRGCSLGFYPAEEGVRVGSAAAWGVGQGSWCCLWGGRHSTALPGVLRTPHGCFLRWVLAAHVAAPEEVARGSLGFVTSARLQRGAG